jgi:hypothetical protein
LALVPCPSPFVRKHGLPHNRTRRRREAIPYVEIQHLLRHEVAGRFLEIVPASSIASPYACPQSKNIDRRDYIRTAIDVSQWSEEFGWPGMLIDADNGLVDPWLVAQIVVQNMQRLIPLVAVPPIYMNPYSVMKFVSSIGLSPQPSDRSQHGGRRLPQ